MRPGRGSKVSCLLISGLLVCAPTLAGRRPAARAAGPGVTPSPQDATDGRGDPASPKKTSPKSPPGRTDTPPGGRDRRRTPRPPKPSGGSDPDKNSAGVRARGERAADYLASARGITRDRIVVLDGGCRTDFAVELWLVPAGAPDPAPTLTRDCGPNAGLGGASERFAAFTKAGFIFAPSPGGSSGSPGRSECPTVTVSCPDTGRAGTPVTFTANISGGDPDAKPTFDWMVSAGRITGGQGTSSITVGTSGFSGTITATVDVGGFDRSCSAANSCTSVFPVRPSARRIDGYGDIRFGAEQAHLNNFAIELLDDPLSRGFIIIYSAAR